jgi:hypothetical protein
MLARQTMKSSRKSQTDDEEILFFSHKKAKKNEEENFPVIINSTVDKYLLQLLNIHHHQKNRVTSCESAAADIYKLLTNSNLKENKNETKGNETDLQAMLKEAPPDDRVLLIDFYHEDDTEDDTGIHTIILIQCSDGSFRLLQAYGDDFCAYSALQMLKYSLILSNNIQIILQKILLTLHQEDEHALIKQKPLYKILCSGNLQIKIDRIEFRSLPLQHDKFLLQHAFENYISYNADESPVIKP